MATRKPPKPKTSGQFPGSRRAKRSPSATAGHAAGHELESEKPSTSTRRARNHCNFPIVGMGASAGGLEAFEQFFTHAPPDGGIAYVLVQHLDPSRSSMLPELLQRLTQMKVVQVKDRMAVQPNFVYLIPPNKDLTIARGILRLSPPSVSRGSRLPIDTFFRSLAEDQRESAIGIILSGTGTDGTLGIRDIKEKCGMVMVQEVKSAKYDGMPASAVETGLADYVLEPAKMPEQLLRYVQHSFPAKKPAPSALVDRATDTLQKIFQVLRTKTAHDFSLYKRNTICRRIERRMNVHQIGNAGSYLRFLQQNPQEVALLFKELLIGVTSFFRDPDAFGVLRRKFLPKLLADKPKDYTVRIWAPGCSTGEEVYSLAMVVSECLAQLKRALKVQIFGTDIDADAIEVARTGAFPNNIEADVTSDRLRRFFTKEDHFYRIKKDVREMVVFAPQNILKDPPFTKLDLVSCRNLLIYLEPELQKKLFPLFHYTLKPSGVLFLGSSESVGSFHELFGALDKKWKIYQRKENNAVTPQVVAFPAQPPPRLGATKDSAHQEKKKREGRLPEIVDKLLLDEYSPACVLINEKSEILYIHGRTGKYLEPAPGQANLNIVEMARSGLKFELAAAIRKASSQEKAVHYPCLPIQGNGGQHFVTLTVKRLTEPETLRGLMLVVFEEVTPSKAPDGLRTKGGAPPQDRQRLVELGQELKYTKEHLQTTIEELETSNEERKSTNEELQSTNEELQSTNEELETSKEELHSLNEELVTVNNELQSKIEQLTQARDDLKNLLDSTKIATIFLDNQLLVRRFTAEATKVINLIPADIGRPVSHIVSNLRYDGLVEDIEAVLSDLVFKEAKVQTKDGQWFLMRIMPYRTVENVIDGVVITFVDIHELLTPRLASEESQALRFASETLQRFGEGIVQTTREPALILDPELRVVAASRSFYEAFGVTPIQIEKKHVYELSDGAWDLPRLRQMLEEIVPRGTHFEDYHVQHTFSATSTRTFLLNARRIFYKEVGVTLILLSFTEQSSAG